MSKALQQCALVLLATASSGMADAAVLSANASTVARVDTYTQYGGGDVIVRLTNNSLAAACPYGFWIRAADAGAKTALAQILAAHHAQSSVVIYADTGVIWSGSGSAACLVWSIQTDG
jgi:hypothetical protein